MKLSLVLIGAVIVPGALSQGFGTVIPHKQHGLCLYAVDKALMELRKCPTQIEIDSDQYPENFKWHYQDARLYNYMLGECIAEDNSKDFVGENCNDNDNNQRFGFIPVRHKRNMILHFETSDW